MYGLKFIIDRIEEDRICVQAAANTTNLIKRVEYLELQ